MLQRLFDAALRSAMRFSLVSSSANWRLLPRPQGAAQAHSPGSDPDRILLFGSGPVMGYGVLDHQLSLAGGLAREISASTGRGVDADVVSDFDIRMASALGQLRELKLGRYAAVLLSVGMNDAVAYTSTAAWRESTEQTLRFLASAVSPNAHIFVLGLQPANDVDLFAWSLARLLQRRAAQLNEVTRQLVAHLPNVTYIEFSAVYPEGAALAPANNRYRTAGTYTRWARAIAPQMVPWLRSAGETRGDAGEVHNEAARQAALDALGILDSEPEERFDRIARLARQLFASSGPVFASIGFIDHDRQWFKSKLNLGVDEIPRADSFSDFAIRRDGTLVVEDAGKDERFSTNPNVMKAEGIRFYVGHPIETRDGERVGALAIFGQLPRTVSQPEQALVRDLALLAQQEVWAWDAERREMTLA